MSQQSSEAGRAQDDYRTQAEQMCFEVARLAEEVRDALRGGRWDANTAVSYWDRFSEVFEAVKRFNSTKRLIYLGTAALKLDEAMEALRIELGEPEVKMEEAREVSEETPPQLPPQLPPSLSPQLLRLQEANQHLIEGQGTGGQGTGGLR